MTDSDYEAGRLSAMNGHGEPSEIWATMPFFLGWFDARVRELHPSQRYEAALRRREIVESYRRKG